MPYIVVKDARYYTGDPLNGSKADALLVWSPYKKTAKRYVKRAWAEKAAAKLHGRVEEVRK